MAEPSHGKQEEKVGILGAQKALPSPQDSLSPMKPCPGAPLAQMPAGPAPWDVLIPVRLSLACAMVPCAQQVLGLCTVVCQAALQCGEYGLGSMVVTVLILSPWAAVPPAKEAVWMSQGHPTRPPLIQVSYIPGDKITVSPRLQDS